ncbi:NUDIX domain-containing protein [Yoonia sp. 2307UL14-13]|uniref:NUDIX domain-containing protein n=1 Tax=Yoonia sp. 2307UL14-13 TaxID=3126506 RepID=UPI0030A884A3
MTTTGQHDGAKVALFLGDKLVSILRDDIPTISYPNLWDLPGGGREGDENTFQTVARELEEELGLVLPSEAVLWESAFRSVSEPTAWVAFFVAQMPPESADRIVFGNEGQRWDLFDFDHFLALENRVPSYGARLQKWVAQTGGLPR